MLLANPFIDRRLDIRLDEVLYFVHAGVHPCHLHHQLRDCVEDQMLALFGVELACELVAVSAGRMMIVFDSRRVVVVADHWMVEDKVDRCSS